MFHKDSFPIFVATRLLSAKESFLIYSPNVTTIGNTKQFTALHATRPSAYYLFFSFFIDIYKMLCQLIAKELESAVNIIEQSNQVFVSLAYDASLLQCVEM